MPTYLIHWELFGKTFQGDTMEWRDMYQHYMFNGGEEAEEKYKKWREQWIEMQDVFQGKENWNILNEIRFETDEEVKDYVKRTCTRSGGLW